MTFYWTQWTVVHRITRLSFEPSFRRLICLANCRSRLYCLFYLQLPPKPGENNDYNSWRLKTEMTLSKLSGVLNCQSTEQINEVRFYLPYLDCVYRFPRGLSFHITERRSRSVIIEKACSLETITTKLGAEAFYPIKYLMPSHSTRQIVSRRLMWPDVTTPLSHQLFAGNHF